MTEFITVPLAGTHDRAAFRCGHPALDDYFLGQASQDMRRKVAAVYVMSPVSEPSRIAGFYTLSSFAVEMCALPEATQKKLPRYPLIPATLIGRLARDLHYPGTGGLLLADAMKRVLAHSMQVASAAIVVDAKDETAKKFYKKYGFVDFPSLGGRMFIPMRDVAVAVQQL